MAHWYPEKYFHVRLAATSMAGMTCAANILVFPTSCTGIICCISSFTNDATFELLLVGSFFAVTAFANGWKSITLVDSHTASMWTNCGCDQNVANMGMLQKELGTEIMLRRQNNAARFRSFPDATSMQALLHLTFNDGSVC